VTLPAVLRDILALPTAAFVEHAVLEYVRRWCARLPGVTVREDRCGNVLARYRHGPASRRKDLDRRRPRPPLAFAAHTDHPGFVARSAAAGGRLLAAFRGWVEPQYFPGANMRFWSAGRWVKGTVEKISVAGKAAGTGRKPAQLFRFRGR
jgi:putative aminopeptidase FrvX